MIRILIVVAAGILFSDFARAQMTKRDESYSSEIEEVRILNHKPGDEVVMKCRDHDGTNNMHEHKWKFSPCDDCDKLKATTFEWQVLPQQKKRLCLKSANVTNNGRYLCTVNGNVIASYQLKVKQEFKFIGRPPKIIDIEKNSTQNGNVVVKCKIVSPIAPRIWWLKQCEGTQKCELAYDGKFYYKINVTYQAMQSEEGVYVSKLHLRNFTHRDDGLYVCLTLTELGNDHRPFTLNLPLSVADEEAEEPESNLNYLFLVPIAFILIPICIDCLGMRIGAKKNKQEAILLEVI